MNVRFRLQYHAYMHIAETDNEDRVPLTEWEGITGTVKSLIGNSEDRLHAHVQSQLGVLRQEIRELKTMLVQVLDEPRH